MSFESFKMEEKFKGNIKRTLKRFFTEEEFKKGFEAFEKLINITDKNSNFNEYYGNKLNDLINGESDIYSECKLKDFLGKIEKLKNLEKGENTNSNPTDEISLKDYYRKLGFFDWLDEESIKQTNVIDCGNVSNALNNQGESEFSIEKADATKYEGCQHNIAEYIIAYQLESGAKSHNTLIQQDDNDEWEKTVSLFFVYLDQCVKNYDLIDEGYKREAINRVDYVKFANEQIEEADDFEDFEDLFLQLNWHDDAEKEFSCDYKKSIKFIGEAGMGKTTQMRNVYFKLLKEVADGKKQVLPIWIELWQMSELRDALLEEKIKAILGEYAEYYDVLLKNNILMLFLDGYNEILTENVKMVLAQDVDDIHTKNPDVFIAMTDRLRNANPPCLGINVEVFACKYMTKEQAKKYIDKKAEKVLKEDILINPKINEQGGIDEVKKSLKEYLDKSDSSWFIRTGIIPAKLNSLIRLLGAGIKPERESEFYREYLIFILDREEKLKKDKRVAKLRNALYVLAMDMKDPNGKRSRVKIHGLWAESKLLMAQSFEEVDDLLNLAIQIPILIPGDDGLYKFVHTQYYHYFYEGLWP